MKCHAGVEFEMGKPCPKCHAKLGEVCWPGINADLLELARFRAALQSIAANGCCDRCQEAALVARKALALTSQDRA